MMARTTLSSVMKGHNPFPTLLAVLLVVRCAGAQELLLQQRRGFVASQGRPGAATPSLHREGGGPGGGRRGSEESGFASLRTTQQQPSPFSSRPASRLQGPQRVVKFLVPKQEEIAIDQQRVTQFPTQQQPQPNINQQRVVHAFNFQQQHLTTDQPRTVQDPTAQPLQVIPNQQRAVQTPTVHQQTTAVGPQRVVQIPGSQQVALGQQRVTQFSNPQQQVITNQHKVVQVPSPQQQHFISPIANTQQLLQTEKQQTARDGEENTGFFQHAFAIQDEAAVPKAVINQSPLPSQRVRPQRVRNNNSRIGGESDTLSLENEEEERRELEEVLHEQARNAHYSFSSKVEDGLNDQMVLREETRDGLLTRGSYSYSDGFFQRTVHYEADENGYRVTGEETRAIGDGPQPNPTGTAHVSNQFGNTHNEYAITAADLAPVQEENVEGQL